MIAAGILAVGFTVLLQAHITNLKMIEYSRIRTKAILLAEKKIAEIEAGGVSGREENPEKSPQFYCEKIITPVRIGNKLLSGVSRVEVVVSWKDGKRDEKVSLVTYLVE